MKRYRFQKEKAPVVRRRLFILFLSITGLLVGLNAFCNGESVCKKEEPTNAVGNTKTSSPLNTEPPQLCSIVIWSEASIREQGFLILVNKQKKWPEGLLPTDLVDLRDYKTSSTYALKDDAMRADKTAAVALDRMLTVAAQQGMSAIVVMSAYRGHEKQRILFEQQVELMLAQTSDRTEAEEMANTTVARPGESEHHTGLAFDLTVQGTEMEQFGETAQFQWFKAHCMEFGFVLRYPPEKADITGISNETWHFRYVGVSVAQEMEKHDWCLEEYLEHNP